MNDLRVVVIGCGYVGLTTSIALAYIGHRIHCIDQNKDLIHSLQEGKVTIYESGVKELLSKVGKKLTFGLWDTFVNDADVILIAVGTPPKSNGDADMSNVEAVARELGHRLETKTPPVIVNKSTVPVGSAKRVESIVRHGLRSRGINVPVPVASNPEFLREGVALFDTFYPDRIVIGTEDIYAVQILRKMYAPILEQTFSPPEMIPRPDGFRSPVLIATSLSSAELIKYAANAFLTMKISYINEIADLAERVGADIKEVKFGIGLDKRIGTKYLNAGIGWGGSCFGKDVQALIHMASLYGCKMQLCEASIQVNRLQREAVIKKLQSALKVLRGRTIGLLGLSFKPGTDDLRDAPSLVIANRLIELGSYVKVYDPVAMDTCRRNYPELDIEYACNVEDLALGADALVLVTEWEEFSRLPFDQLGKRMRQKIIVDGRNELNSKDLVKSGFLYFGIGR